MIAKVASTALQAKVRKQTVSAIGSASLVQCDYNEITNICDPRVSQIFFMSWYTYLYPDRMPFAPRRNRIAFPKE